MDDEKTSTTHSKYLGKSHQEVFDELLQQAESVLDGPGWTNVKEANTTVGPCLLRKKKCGEKGKPEYYAGAVCTMKGITADEFLKTVVVGMTEGVKNWDKTLVEVSVIQQITDQDMIYQYIYDPGRVFFLISKRDMVYYEGWRKTADGMIQNVGSSLPVTSDLVPLPSSTVRSILLIHYKRATPVDNGTSVKYETYQHIDMSGKLPNSMAFDGILDGLVTEINGFFPKGK